MSAALQPPWTVDRFLAWVVHQEGRYEFDGIQPVDMTGGTARHNRIITNVHAALRPRLRGTQCSYYGPDLGVLTPDGKVRYPDVLVTCSKFPDTALLAPEPVILFEVLSSDSGRRDRIEKVRDYGSVRSVRRYVMIESTTSGLMVLHRGSGAEPFTTTTLTETDMLDLPEIGARVPVAEIYEDVDFGDPATISSAR